MPTNALGVGVFGESARVVDPIALFVRDEQPTHERHVGLDAGVSPGAACAAPPPNTRAAPAPAMATPVAIGHKEFFISSS
jgi:hypothetical protein